MRVITHTTLPEKLNLRLRKSKPGPELDLVNWFLDARPFRTPKNCVALAFVEPAIESGFPDIVLVFLHQPTAEEWPTEREDLLQCDFRLLELLRGIGGAESGHLKRILGRRVEESVERLRRARLIRKLHHSWIPISLSRTYAAQGVVAIEAKTNQIRSVLAQAHLNTWFASASFVLLPELPKGHGWLEQAKRRGIGICTKENTSIITTPGKSRGPVSYATWLFNDWAWRVWRCV